MTRDDLNNLLLVEYNYAVEDTDMLSPVTIIRFFCEPVITISIPCSTASILSAMQSALTEILGTMMANGKKLPVRINPDEYEECPSISVCPQISYAYRNMSKRDRERIELRIKLQRVLQDDDTVDGILNMVDDYADSILEEGK